MAWQVCDLCGGLVADWTAHVAWHKALKPPGTPSPVIATDPAHTKEHV